MAKRITTKNKLMLRIELALQRVAAKGYTQFSIHDFFNLHSVLYAITGVKSLSPEDVRDFILIYIQPTNHGVLKELIDTNNPDYFIRALFPLVAFGKNENNLLLNFLKNLTFHIYGYEIANPVDPTLSLMRPFIIIIIHAVFRFLTRLPINH